MKEGSVRTKRMEVEASLGGTLDATTPKSEEIDRAIIEINSKFRTPDKVKAVIYKLYTLYIKDQGNEDPCHHMQPQLDIAGESEAESLNTMTETQYRAFKNEIQFICYVQKRIAAQTFIRRGYGIDLFREQIEKRGGLFFIIESRYKSISKEIVSETYLTIQDFLVRNCGLAVNPLNKLQITCLHSILLNCRCLFNRKEIITFLSFIALMYEQACISIQVSNQDAISFYQSANKLLQLKLQQGRKAFKLRLTQQPNQQNESIVNHNQQSCSQSNKKQNEKHLMEIYIKQEKISQTKAKYLKLYGFDEEYYTSDGVKAAIFRIIRKTIKEIQQFSQKFQILPRLSMINDQIIKKILATTEGTYTRVQIITFALHLLERQNLTQRQNDQEEQEYSLKGLDVNVFTKTVNCINRFVFIYHKEERTKE